LNFELSTQIPLTRGLFALVDVEDYEHLNRFKWQARRSGRLYYGYRHLRKGEVGYVDRPHDVLRSMGEELIGRPKGLLVDHRNRNTLDYRKSNLRWATVRQNAQNGWRAAKGRYKGVMKLRHTFRARIHVPGQQSHIGCFETAHEAAMAYNEAALKYYGAFARLNPME